MNYKVVTITEEFRREESSVWRGVKESVNYLMKIWRVLIIQIKIRCYGYILCDSVQKGSYRFWKESDQVIQSGISDKLSGNKVKS